MKTKFLTFAGLLLISCQAFSQSQQTPIAPNWKDEKALLISVFQERIDCVEHATNEASFSACSGPPADSKPNGYVEGIRPQPTKAIPETKQ